MTSDYPYGHPDGFTPDEGGPAAPAIDVTAELRKVHQQQQAEKAAASTGASKVVKGRFPASEGFTPRADSTARWGKRSLSHSKRLQNLYRCIQLETVRQRNSLTRRVRLLRIRTALDLKDVTAQDIASRVLEAQDSRAGHVFEPLTAEDRLAMEKPVVEWLIPGFLPRADFTIIGGRPKVGKTWLAVDMAHSILAGRDFLSFGAPAAACPVILVTDDQADGDTADMLTGMGIWDHPGLLWSRHFRLNEQNLDRLLDTITANPGAVVILDSLRSISRHLKYGENDPEIGAMLYDLKAVVLNAGGTLVVIHHCNKGEDQVGTEALSGHNAIAGSANTILTFHYLTVDGKPVKDSPQRRLVREARSGAGFDLVVSRTPGGCNFYRVGSYADWQEQAEEAAKQEKAESRLTEQQRQVLEVLGGAPNRWWTVRDTAVAMGLEWEGGNRGPGQNVTRWLSRLVELGIADERRTGNAKTFRASPAGPPRGEPDEPDEPDEPTAGDGISARHPNDEPDELTGLDESAAADLPLLSTQGDESTSHAPQGVRQVRHLGDESTSLALQGVRQVRQIRHPSEGHGIRDPGPNAAPPWLPELRKLVAAKPDWAAAQFAQALDPHGTGRPLGREVRPWLERICREA